MNKILTLIIVGLIAIIKLVFTGLFLAIGFTLGHLAVNKIKEKTKKISPAAQPRKEAIF